MAKKGGKRDGSKGRAISAALSANPGATAKQIQAAVVKGGLSVSLGMIAKIKGGLKASGKKKKPAAAKKAPVKRKKAVAKKKKGAKRGRRPGGGASMSDAIRAYMARNPSASRSAVRDGVQAQGVAVKDSLVSAVYYKVKASGGKPAAKRGPGRPRKAAPAAKAKKAAPAARATSGLSAAQLITAKGLADQLGGIAKVREALDLIERLS